MSTSSDSAINLSVPRSTIRTIAIAVAAVIALAVAALLVLGVAHALSPGDSLAAEVNSNEYQAVFLTSSEVYFGKLTVPSGGSFVSLRHVYRLTQTASTRKGQPLQRTLVKLVSDLNGPEDLLVINRAQILYVENLNPSGRAAQLLQAGTNP